MLNEGALGEFYPLSLLRKGERVQEAKKTD